MIEKERTHCSHCKYFQIDGMFGLWCDKGLNWEEVKYCKYFERNRKRMTKTEMIDELDNISDENKKLKKENEQLKFKNRGLQSELEIRKADVDYANKINIELFDKCKQYKKENEQLKKEKEFWKSDACSLSSLNCILSNELSIAQEQGYKPSKPYKEYIASIKTEYSKFWENKIKTHNNQIKRSCKND